MCGILCAFDLKQNALEWDEAFKNMNEPSGRAIANVHDKSYTKS